MEKALFKPAKFNSVIATEDIAADKDLIIPFCADAGQACDAPKCFRMKDADLDGVDHWIFPGKNPVSQGVFDPSWSIPTVPAHLMGKTEPQFRVMYQYRSCTCDQHGPLLSMAPKYESERFPKDRKEGVKAAPEKLRPVKGFQR